MDIVIDIKRCNECPNFSEERYYSPDSFEAPSFDWYCEKAGHRKIRGYVEWHEENKIKIPDWCPCKAKKVKNIETSTETITYPVLTRLEALESTEIR
jgi:hypothetical protein